MSIILEGIDLPKNKDEYKIIRIYGNGRTWEDKTLVGHATQIPTPRVGRWIDTNMTCYGAKVYKCSVCDNEIDEMPTEMGEPIWNHCPNCGAKIERRDDEHNTERD